MNFRGEEIVGHSYNAARSANKYFLLPPSQHTGSEGDVGMTVNTTNSVLFKYITIIYSFFWGGRTFVSFLLYTTSLSDTSIHTDLQILLNSF